MYLIQILLVLFFIFALVKVFIRYKKGELKIGIFLGWVLFWAMAGVVAVVPNSTAYFAELVGVGRGADLVVYLSLVLIFFMLFRLYIKIENQEKNITKIVRQDTLSNKK